MTMYANTYPKNINGETVDVEAGAVRFMWRDGQAYYRFSPTYSLPGMVGPNRDPLGVASLESARPILAALPVWCCTSTHPAIKHARSASCVRPHVTPSIEED